MGWLDRMDARNQRVLERATARANAHATADDDPEDPLTAVGSYLTWVPSIVVGLVGVIMMLLGSRRRRGARRD